MLKSIRVIGVSAAFLLLGWTARVGARQEKQEEKSEPARQEQQAKPEKQQARAPQQQQAKPERQEQTRGPQQQNQARPEKQQQAKAPRQEQQAKPEKQQAGPARQERQQATGKQAGATAGRIFTPSPAHTAGDGCTTLTAGAPPQHQRER